ncbi:MAG: DUF4236 domain-containing protein [Alphaproteobacteria bacterium]|nr:DUF4236 domain-containing protein [Alphaproteobacteria bacterium]
MGFRFRKSIDVLGLFRINFSKSGISFSYGLPGYRVTKMANGQTRKTVSIPGTGVSHVTTSGKTKKAKAAEEKKTKKVASKK